MTPESSPAGGGLHGNLVRAEAADTGTLSQVIADAFHPLAPSRWLVADLAARREIFPAYFRLYVEEAMASGVVHTTTDCTAAALWIPTGQDTPGQPDDCSARLAAAAGPWIDRFLAFDAALDRHHPSGIPHHHLAILAVRPDRQGRGTGTALLRAYHQILDHQARASAYLEAADLRTRQIYLRHGYADHGPPIQLPGGPLMYPMWRECRSTEVTAGGPGECAEHPEGKQIAPLPRRIPGGHTTMHPADNRPQSAALEKLAAELRVRGYEAQLIAPDGQPPSLVVTNPHAAMLNEMVMADATSFLWPWADPIAAVSDVTAAADVIARVLAAVPGDGPA
jgi:GNAT superfamily N-acetyltransferase